MSEAEFAGVSSTNFVLGYPSATDSHLLTTIINKVKKSIDDTGKTNDSHDIHSFLTSDLGTPLPLHISLSRPIGFLTEKKDDFVTSLDSVLKVAGVHPSVDPFSAVYIC